MSSGRASNGCARLRRSLDRARAAHRRRRPGRSLAGRLATAAVCLLAGLLVAVSALNARGTDLRPGRNTDLVSLVQSQSRRNVELGRELAVLRQDVDRLSEGRPVETGRQPRLDEQSNLAGLRPVTGQAVTVTLSDAPESVASDGVDEDLLVVHQQDIQSVVNALWSGGAEAMTIQGQRVISTTGVKCVGNTVVLHGIPYAPPYVVSAMGDQQRLRSALSQSPAVTIYQQYVDAYGLGYAERLEAKAQFPAYQGALDLQHARELVPAPRPEGGASGPSGRASATPTAPR